MNKQTSSQKVIVIVAMLDSSHTAGWLKQFIDCDFRFILIPSTPHRKINKGIKQLLLNHENATFSLSRFNRYSALPLGIIDLILKIQTRSYFLNRQLSQIKDKIEFVHVHEIQHAGYLVLNTIKNWVVKPKLVVSVWGSDLYWFQQFKKHSTKITELMKITDQLICECARDISIAKSFGYMGNHVVVMPVSGGLKTGSMEATLTPPSLRKTILVKGYTGFVGRADLALESIGRIAPHLLDFAIVVYSSDFKSRRIARNVQKSSGLDIRTHRRKSLTQDEMLNLFQSSRIYIGISESDGLSVSMLEAMASGCFPIQTSTSCAVEIIKNGQSGFIVDLNDKQKLDSSILQASRDDLLVDNSAIINLNATKLTRELDYVKELAISVYHRILE
jgi:glycosyltransferase involved in cell wall biosynthesis